MSENKRPLILVTNDDGITSKGIKTLVEIVQEIGDVLVVAPDSPQSGMGHAITIGNTLRIEASNVFTDLPSYECSGTPVDCVKLAKSVVLKGRLPDLVVSGINHGSNSSISVIYSGTMSAAIEGAIEGIPAIGFSLCDYEHDANFDHVKKQVHDIVVQVLKTGLPKGIALNVNIPAFAQGEIKGIKVCRQSMCKWKDDFDTRKDPYGKKYYWMTGEFVHHDKGEDTDEYWLEKGYISVVPCQYDLTAHYAIGQLNSDWTL